MNEAERIARLAGILGSGGAGVELGIGDDGAVVAASMTPLVWSIDAAVEHVHFERAWLDAECLGYRATMAALSDLAAMGATPLGVLAALVLPPTLDEAWLDGIARGQRRACDEVETAVIGGNLSRGAELSITTSVLGTAARAMRRDRVRPGDALWLAGPVGLARAGFHALLKGELPGESDLHAWRYPRARIGEGLAACAVAEAAIDVSDGLAVDAARLAEASSVALEFDAAALLDDTLRAAAARVGMAPLELALYGGEDYALLVAAPEGAAFGPEFRRIGSARPVTEAERVARSWVWLNEGTLRRPVLARGFDHFE